MSVSTIPVGVKRFLAALMLFGSALPASAELVGPYKDALFAYPALVESQDKGDFRVVDYQELRDINERDDIPERRVKRAYVSLGVKSEQAFESVDAGGRSVEVLRVGAARGAAFTVIFIHGRGGDRRLGANDYTFGGNFNRLKNLAVNGRGVYYAPTVRSFDENGVADVAALIHHAATQSPGRPVILACASMGTFICWGITRDRQAVADLQGMMILAGPADPAFLKSAAHQARLPLFFSHGSADSVYPAEAQIALYRQLKAAGYPTRFVLFRSGTHGTPVRMTDWRETLNWFDAR
ncbi:phospholipase [Rhizobium rhizosphaerae]|uniref:Phospholipase n=1 Tax=Xaviernesmea rhizosphaerae TaxID=1672749 RepID=A0A1Q9AJ83_9HYPH|nr:alpha/beta fold hydrolase [Xaviernesmea rhizosphaerae]OLP55336.1 phospholipase [Xaviernesmea rhizosphaerae]